MNAFSPTSAQASNLIDALADHTASLRDIAKAHQTNLESLAAWLSLPQVQARLANIQAAVAHRTRYLASLQADAAVRAATRILQIFNKPADPSATPDRHWCETARRAGGFLQRAAQPPKILKEKPTAPVPTGASRLAAAAPEPARHTNSRCAASASDRAEVSHPEAPAQSQPGADNAAPPAIPAASTQSTRPTPHHKLTNPASPHHLITLSPQLASSSP